MAVSEGAIIPAAVFNSLIPYRYSEFAEKTIYQWSPYKIQDLHIQQEYLLLELVQYLESVR